jgi:uncharacterized protein
MTRIVLLVLAVLVFIWLLRRALAARKPGGQDASVTPPPVSELVSCARCGVHLPKGEAVVDLEQAAPGVERYFCSPEHLRLGAK